MSPKRAGRKVAELAGNQRGFGMVEMAITMAIAAILVLVAIPNLRELGLRSNVTQTNNELVTALNLARAEAAKRGVPVAVISTSASANWTTGWSIRADPTLDNSFATIVQNHGAIPNGYGVFAKANGGGQDSRVVFTAMGALRDAAFVDLSVCRPVTNRSTGANRWIQVAGSGLITTHRNSAGSTATGGGC